MLLSIVRTCLVAALLPICAFADYKITTPDPNQNDLSQTYTSGDTVTIQWNAGWQGAGADPKFADLFITWFNSDSYIAVITGATNLTTSSTGIFRWRINVPDDVIRTDDAFVFRFTTARNPPSYQPNGVMAPSRGFKLRVSSSASSAAISTTASRSTASSVAALTLTSTSSASASSSAPTSSGAPSGGGGGSSTPVGAIVGGVLGGVALIALVVIAWLLYRLLQKKKEKRQMQDEPHHGDPYTMAQTGKDPHGPAPHYDQTAYQPQPPPSELMGSHVAHETDGSWPGGHGR